MTVYDPSPLCEAHCLSGRPQFSFWHPFAYEPAVSLRPREDVAWWNAAPPDNRLRFVECNDRAVQYVRHFLALEHTDVAWFHVIVRAAVLDAFFHALQTYIDCKHPNAFLLEHSCWCDGGLPSLDPLFRHHRHMIVVARHGNHFIQQCWKKIQGPEVPGVPSKVFRKIRSWQHLRNTLFYVSCRKATCNIGQPATQTPAELLHYYIFEPLTTHFKLCVALSVPGGINDFVSMYMRSCPVTEFARHCAFRAESGYAVPIRHVMEEVWAHTVVPVRKDFVPTGVVNETPSAAYLILPDGRYMHFEQNKAASHLEDSAWVRLQREKGNHFLEAVKDAWWIPPHHQQHALEELMPERLGGAEALQRQNADFSTLLDDQRTFFLNLLEQTRTSHRTLVEYQKTFYQLRYKLRKTYLENIIDWCDERSREVEKQREYYKRRWEAAKVILLNPSISSEAKMRQLMESVSDEKEEKAEEERREKVEGAGYWTRVRWEECKRKGEEELENLHKLLQQYKQLCEDRYEVEMKSIPSLTDGL